MDRRSIPKRSISLQSLQNGLIIHIHKTQHSVNYIVSKKSEPIINRVRGPTCSENVGLPRSVCGSVCVLSVLVFKISMLIPSDESFGKSAITLSTTCCQRTPHACAAAQLRFATERKKTRSPFYNSDISSSSRSVSFCENEFDQTFVISFLISGFRGVTKSADYKITKSQYACYVGVSVQLFFFVPLLLGNRLCQAIRGMGESK